MKDFFKSKGLTVAAATLVVLVIAVSTALLLPSRSSMFETAVRTVFSPVEKGMSMALDGLESVYNYMYKYDQLAAENEALKLQIAEMESQFRESAAANEEIEQLRELLGLSKEHTDFKFESASLLEWSSSNWGSTFTLNRGSNSNIAVNDCVITSSGYLVGVVTSTTPYSSTVRSIIDPKTSIGAYVESSGASTIACGDFTLMTDKKLKLTYIPDGTELSGGDYVITSGSGSIYPRGLVIGRISGVGFNDTGYSNYAVIEPCAELSELSQLFIITDFEIAG